jgi:hypothetical protein
MLAHEWVEENQVHDAAAKAWIEALHKHNAIDSPNRKKSGTPEATSSSGARKLPIRAASSSTGKGKKEEPQLVFPEDKNVGEKVDGDAELGNILVSLLMMGHLQIAQKRGKRIERVRRPQS